MFSVQKLHTVSYVSFLLQRAVEPAQTYLMDYCLEQQLTPLNPVKISQQIAPLEIIGSNQMVPHTFSQSTVIQINL